MIFPGFIDKYCIENEDNIYNAVTLSKDEMLWKGSEFISDDLENHKNHILTKFIIYLSNCLSEDYSSEFAELLYEFNSVSLQERNIKKFSNKTIIKEESLKCLNKELGSYNESFKNNSIVCDSTRNYRYSSFTNNIFKSDSMLNENLSSSIEIENKISSLYNTIIKEVINFATLITGAIIRFYAIKTTASPKLFEVFCEKVKDLMLRGNLFNLLYKIKTKILENQNNLYMRIF